MGTWDLLPLHAPRDAMHKPDAKGDKRNFTSELTTLSQTPEFRLGTQEHLVLLLNWYPHFLDQSYAPASNPLLHQQFSI